MKIKKLLISAASLIVSVALCATVGISKPELHAHANSEDEQIPVVGGNVFSDEFIELFDMDETIEPDQKEYCNATLEDEFADDKVGIVLMHDVSIKAKIYTKDSFSVSGIKEVKDLTQYYVSIIRKGTFEEGNEFNINKFHQILELTLCEKSKENVLRVVKELEKLDYIMVAQPMYIHHYKAYANDVIPDRPCFGDTNHDGKINLEDVVALQKHIAQIYDCTVCRTCGDITGEGLVLDLEDVVALQRYIAKLSDSGKCGKESDSHAFLEPRNTDSETIKKIETAYEKSNPISDSDKEALLKNFDKLFDAKFYDTLSNGAMIVRCDYYGSATPAINVKKVIGNYIYYCSSPGQEKYLLIGDRYVSIEDAYKEKLISDEIFRELAFKLHMYWRATYTLDNEFEDNTVLVCLTNEASRMLAVYEPSQFGIDGIIEVTDLTDATRVRLLEQRNNPNISEDKKLRDESKYTQILMLTLSEHSKQNVLDTIEELIKLDIVKSAEPNLMEAKPV
ncbi:MAG: hypothetical protein K6F76_00630 [Clostridiales bacterium]|nr:hypothetical protein [Clostridiales bacterium]